MLLQPTSPFRTAGDIDSALEKFTRCGEKPLASVSVAEESPYLMRELTSDTSMRKLFDASSTMRRQDMPKFFCVNGSIYINAISQINGSTSFNDNEIPFVMERSHSVDIDEWADLEKARFYLHLGRRMSG